MSAKSKESDFGHALLAAIEKRASADNGRDRVFMDTLGAVVRDALGLPGPESYPAPPSYQSTVPPEFPQWRVKYDSDFNEVDRKLCRSLEHLGELRQHDPTIVAWRVLPVDAPAPKPRTDEPQGGKRKRKV